MQVTLNFSPSSWRLLGDILEALGARKMSDSPPARSGTNPEAYGYLVRAAERTRDKARAMTTGSTWVSELTIDAYRVFASGDWPETKSALLRLITTAADWLEEGEKGNIQ